MRENTQPGSSKTVKIGNKLYDVATGLPLPETSDNSSPKPNSTPKKQHTTAAHVHAKTQKSQTLHRRATKKPATNTQGSAKPRQVRSMDISRHPHVTKFSPHGTQAPATPAAKPHKPSTKPDKPAQTHPVVAKAHAARAQAVTPKPQTAHKPAVEVKNQEIAKALATPKPKHPKKNFFKRHPRIFSAVTVSIVLLVLAGYLTYLNIPSLSVKVAAARAGIAASYPQYKPDGYSLRNPVSSEEGRVVLTFKANTGDLAFTITQARSSWDSEAVRAMVEAESDGQFITTQDRGLTIYTYNGNAAWVNRGILYHLEGNAPLSSEQIQRIAASL